jgi:hypothetical protein
MRLNNNSNNKLSRVSSQATTKTSSTKTSSTKVSTTSAPSFQWRHADPKVVRMISDFLPPSRRHYLRKGCYEWNELLAPINYEIINPSLHIKKNGSEIVQMYGKHVLKADAETLFSPGEFHRYIIGVAHNITLIEFCGIPSWSKYWKGTFRSYLDYCEDRINWQHIHTIILSSKYDSDLPDWTHLNNILDRQILVRLNEIRLKNFNDMLHWSSTFPLRTVLERLEINCSTQAQFDQYKDVIPRFPNLRYLRITLSPEVRVTWNDLMIIFIIIRRLENLDSFHLLIDSFFHTTDPSLDALNRSFSKFMLSNFKEFVFLFRVEDLHSTTMQYIKRLTKEALVENAPALEKLHLPVVDTEILSLISVQCPNLEELVFLTELPKPFTLFKPMNKLHRLCIPGFTNAALKNSELIHMIMPNIGLLWISRTDCKDIYPPHWHEVALLFPDVYTLTFCKPVNPHDLKKLSEMKIVLPWVKVSVGGIDFFSLTYLRKIIQKCPEIVALAILKKKLKPTMKGDADYKMFPNVEVFSAEFDEFYRPFERIDIRLTNRRTGTEDRLSEQPNLVDKLVKPFTRLFVN